MITFSPIQSPQKLSPETEKHSNIICLSALGAGAEGWKIRSESVNIGGKNTDSRKKLSSPFKFENRQRSIFKGTNLERYKKPEVQPCVPGREEFQ